MPQDAPQDRDSSLGLKGMGLLLFKGVVAAAGAVSVIATAIYVLFPSAVPRDKLGAELDRVLVQQGVPLDTYNEEMGLAKDAKAGNPMGVVVLVHAKLLGFEDRGYTADVFAVDATTHRDLIPSRDGTAAACGVKSPGANEDAVAWRCWLTAPASGQEFTVRVELSDLGPQEDLGNGRVERRLLDFMEGPTLTSST